MNNRRAVVSRIGFICLLVGLAAGLAFAALNHPPPVRAAESIGEVPTPADESSSVAEE